MFLSFDFRTRSNWCIFCRSPFIENPNDDDFIYLRFACDNDAFARQVQILMNEQTHRCNSWPWLSGKVSWDTWKYFSLMLWNPMMIISIHIPLFHMRFMKLCDYNMCQRISLLLYFVQGLWGRTFSVNHSMRIDGIFIPLLNEYFVLTLNLPW